VNDHGFDDSRNDTLSRALRQAAPQPPFDDVDWMALHARIGAAAQPTLAAVAAARAVEVARADSAARRPPDVWQPLAGWSPFGIPLAAAATVLLMIGAVAAGSVGRDAPGDATTSFHTLEEELVSGLGAGAGPILAGIGPDDMLDAVLFYGGEDW
jgi:hypothetical protein